MWNNFFLQNSKIYILHGKKNFAAVSKNLARYISENNVVKPSKVIM